MYIVLQIIRYSFNDWQGIEVWKSIVKGCVWRREVKFHPFFTPVPGQGRLARPSSSVRLRRKAIMRPF